MKTFKIGGVHPSENKLSATSPIRRAGLPKQAVFSLYQHIGAPAKPVVAKGDEVKVGMMLAEADGFVSVPVHSSVSGKVSKIDAIVDASGYRRPAIFVDVEGDEWVETIDRTPDLVTLGQRPELTAEDIVNKVKAAGIVGMGGATFPCHVKLTPPKGTKAECVIINAVECEPYLTADHRLLLEKPDEILVGVDLIMKAVGVNKGYIGIENNKPDAIALLTEKAKAYSHIEIVPLQVKYPQGGEKQLIAAVTGREVPAPPALPINVGAVVQNVGTVFAIYEAVMKNKPLFERVITVTGKEVQNPSNLLAPYRYADEPTHRGMRRLAGKYRKSNRRWPDDGKGTDEPRRTGMQRFLRSFAHERKGIPPCGTAALHPLRQMRQCLSDGARTLFVGHSFRVAQLGVGRRERHHVMYRMRVVPVYLSFHTPDVG